MNSEKKTKSETLSRRDFQKTAGAAAAAFGFQFVPSHVWGVNERPTLAGIGCGGKGDSDIGNSAAAGFQIVGLVDVVDVKRAPELKDSRYKSLIAQREKFPDAKFYQKWSDMLADLGNKVDAVTISTPDHHHAHAAVAAMKAGKHVYCQKPLTHGIWEARMLTKVAKETGVKTQMGNQAHANDHLRRCAELIRAGVLGKIKSVYAWTNRPIWPQGFPTAPAAEAVPEWIDWDQWIGPAPMVDYSSKIAPFNWRGWWNFGSGALGDMACHVMDMSWWALDLAAPIAVSGKQEGGSALSAPINSTLTYEFAPNQYTVAEGLRYHWYDGQIGAKFDAENWKLIPGEFNRPDKILSGIDHTEGKGYDCVVIGEKGAMFFNRSKDNWIVRPGSALDGFTAWPQKSLPRARENNPHVEFFDAITGKIDQAASNFSLAGPFTEMVLIGTLAQRVPDTRLEWDYEKMEVKGRPDMAPFIKREYRKGWELKV